MDTNHSLCAVLFTVEDDRKKRRNNADYNIGKKTLHIKIFPDKDHNGYNGPIISDHSSKNYREHGKIQQESEKETTP